jgi:hypothetical protein
MPNRKNEKHIVTELKGAPEQVPEEAARYAEWARHILWLNNKVVPSAYNMSFGWYLTRQPKSLPAEF